MPALKPMLKREENESLRDYAIRCLKAEGVGLKTDDTPATSVGLVFNKKNNTSHLRHLMSDLIEMKTLENRRYLVCPTVLLCEGVHNGFYYNAEELSKFPDAWNRRPVVVTVQGHPEDDNGRPETAGTPENMVSMEVGTLFNTVWDAEALKLRSEVWIDILRCKEKAPHVLEMIHENANLEVSTGLFTDCDMIPGTWNDEDFMGTVCNYRPDHLALLPNLVGACSWNDGAGLPRINKETKKEEDMANDKNEKGPMAVLKALAKKMGISINEISHDAVHGQLNSLVRDKINPGPNDFVWVEAVFNESFIYLSEADGKTKIFRQNYQTDASDQVSLVGEPVEVVEKREFVPVAVTNKKEDNTNIGGSGKDQDTTVNTGGPEMDRSKMVDALIKNTDWSEGDREMLVGLTDEQFAKVNVTVKAVDSDDNADAAPVADAAPDTDAAPADDDNADAAPVVDAPVENKATTLQEYIASAPEGMRAPLQQMAAQNASQKAILVAALVGNALCTFTEDQLKSKDIDELHVLAKMGRVEPDFSGQAPAYVTANDGSKEEIPGMPSQEEYIRNSRNKKS